jgi:16S rRNA (guanine527-N7)-methyltransferase
LRPDDEAVPPSAAELGVSRETQHRLRAFVDLLARWSRTINLIGGADVSTIWTRHIADSLQLLPLLAGRTPPAIDLGSGGGFPGLVLAIASGWHFHLIEADRRKAAFLREAARVLAAPVSVHASRIEAARQPPADVLTVRALGPLARVLALAQPLLRPGGVLLCLKGRNVGQELTTARARWQMRLDIIPSRSDPGARVLQISEINHVR